MNRILMRWEWPSFNHWHWMSRRKNPSLSSRTQRGLAIKLEDTWWMFRAMFFAVQLNSWFCYLFLFPIQFGTISYAENDDHTYLPLFTSLFHHLFLISDKRRLFKFLICEILQVKTSRNFGSSPYGNTLDLSNRSQLSLPPPFTRTSSMERMVLRNQRS